MNDRWRIRLMLALVLVASCGRRTLSGDGGADGSGAAGVPGAGGRGGGGGAAGQAGAFGPGAAGGPGAGGDAGGGAAGTGGAAGAGATGGTFATGGTGGGGGRGGTSATAGTGGVGGSGGAAGTSDVAGRGGVAGTSDVAGRGGAGGRGGSGGVGGRGGSGGSGGSGGRGGTGGADCSTCRTAILPIEARALVYSAARNEIYVSVQGDAATHPNSIVVVDPTTAAVRSAIPIGSNPGTLALSDDGSTLWAAIEGAHAFRKVTMSATPPVVGPLIHLPMSRATNYFDAASMAVLAGTPLSVVMVLSDRGYTTEVRVFDDGVPRGAGVTARNGTIVTAGPPATAFGGDVEAPNLYVYAVTPSGITATTHSVLKYSVVDSLVYAGGRVFSGGGDTLDVTNLAAPSWAGRLPYQGPIGRRDAVSMMMLTITSTTRPSLQRADIRIYSNDQLAEVAAVPLPDSVGPTGGTYSHLVHAGGDAAAFIRRDFTSNAKPAVVIVHDPAFGAPVGGTGGASGTGGGGGGSGGAGGTGGAPDPCPGCKFTTVEAYGRDMVHDPTRNLIYIASHASAPVHPSSIIVVDAATGAVLSSVPVGNDPQSLALSDDGSALWVGLLGEGRVRRLTPGATLVPGPAYSLPKLLTTGEASAPISVAVLPGAPSSIAVGVQGTGSADYYGRRAVFILDDGQPRANFIQPPEVGASFLVNGPPGRLLGVGDTSNLLVFRLTAVGATLDSFGGLFGILNNTSDFIYSAGAAYASTGEVVDLTNPDAPLPAGLFPPGGSCKLALRNATRVMMLCPDYGPGGILHMLDNTTFTRAGFVVLPNEQYAEQWVKFLYLGGDAVAFLGYYGPLRIMRAPMIGSPP